MNSSVMTSRRSLLFNLPVHLVFHSCICLSRSFVQRYDKLCFHRPSGNLLILISKGQWLARTILHMYSLTHVLIDALVDGHGY
ncbi:hypothetical protein JAAARDRAFT_523472 [Jaapia argillacea MUCL 33604]|uniref:Uncharacterized protein n=1 Tax=Jaapia argillacea MUCL 33604 TaxID=933084 RepID=A0A067Q499_9AGAM|nr:hypothetical protein JAAARDRAFT_523472 [Jaapia argillacea MUCL 33604]